jgi:hypothetical protein
VWKSSHRQLQHCMISGFHCGIREIFFLLEFPVTDITSHIFNGPAKLSQNFSNYQKMLCNIQEEQRFQLQNLSCAVQIYISMLTLWNAWVRVILEKRIFPQLGTKFSMFTEIQIFIAMVTRTHHILSQIHPFHTTATYFIKFPLLKTNSCTYFENSFTFTLKH